MSGKVAMLVDAAECIGCNNCVLASKDEYTGNNHAGYIAASPPGGIEWFAVAHHMRGARPIVDVTHVPKTCRHCDNAPCIAAAGADVIRKRADGVVMIDPEQGKGRRDLVDACPFGAIHWNEAENVAQNWIFDAHLLDHGWKEPRAVQACPTPALRLFRGTDAQLASLCEKEGYGPLPNEADVRPRVLYRNIDPLQTVFIAGVAIHVRPDGIVANCHSAEVTLHLDDAPAGSTRTDEFGMFKLDGLPARGQPFTLTLSHSQVGRAKVSGVLDATIVLEPITLVA